MVTGVGSRVVAKPFWRRMSRYTIGSIICFVVAEVTFVALFKPHLLGARGASVVASIVGIIPGYTLNRNWTWGRRGRSDIWREVVPYWAAALVSTVLAALATGAANDAFADYSRDTRTIVNATAYMLTYGVLFIAKYILFDRVLFAHRPHADPTATTVKLDDDDAVVRARTFGR